MVLLNNDGGSPNLVLLKEVGYWNLATIWTAKARIELFSFMSVCLWDFPPSARAWLHICVPEMDCIFLLCLEPYDWALLCSCAQGKCAMGNLLGVLVDLKMLHSVVSSETISWTWSCFVHFKMLQDCLCLVLGSFKCDCSNICMLGAASVMKVRVPGGKWRQ